MKRKPENMKQLDMQSQGMSIFRSMQFKRRDMGQRDSWRAMATAGAELGAITHGGSNQGMLALTDGSGHQDVSSAQAPVSEAGGNDDHLQSRSTLRQQNWQRCRWSL